MTTTSNQEAVSRLAASMRLRRRLPAPALRRAIRANAGVSTAEVAAAIGVTRQAVSNWERGLRSPRGAQLEAYIAVLEELQRDVA
jgi:DNA-binding transcriptional regulator YiaG